MSPLRLSTRIGQTLAVFQHLSDLSVDWALRRLRSAGETPSSVETHPRSVRGRFQSASRFVTELWDSYLEHYGSIKRR